MSDDSDERQRVLNVLQRRIIESRLSPFAGLVVGYVWSALGSGKSVGDILRFGGMIAVIGAIVFVGAIPLFRMFQFIGPPTWVTSEALVAKGNRRWHAAVVIARAAIGMLGGYFLGRFA